MSPPGTILLAKVNRRSNIVDLGDCISQSSSLSDTRAIDLLCYEIGRDIIVRDGIMARNVELYGCGCSVTSGSKLDAGLSISKA